MTRLSATQVAREFSSVLNRVGSGEEIEVVRNGAPVVAPQTVRSHRNEGDEPVELWAISRQSESDGGEKVDDFWEASPEAARHR